MRFEEQVGIKLRDTFPFAVLSNVPLYRPDVPEERLAGYEIDHLLHASSPLVDRVFIIECKEPPYSVQRETNNRVPVALGTSRGLRAGETVSAKSRIMHGR